MTPAELLTDAVGRYVETAEGVVDSLSEDQLSQRPGPEANSIAWLVWHLSRVTDDHVADVAGTDQVYTSQGFAERFGFDLPDGDIGYGHTSDQVAQVRASAELLTAYLRAVHAMVRDYLAGVSEADLDRVVDERWHPPVTLGVRLVSVVNDGTQHAGQAAYVRGLLGF